MDLLACMATFVRVVETGSISAAARDREISVAAASRHVRALEESAGVVFILRTSRQRSITEAGRRYYEHCLRVLRAVADAQASARESREVAGRLTVTAPVTLGLEVLVPRLPSLLREHPQLRVDLRLEDHFVDLVAEGVDVAIRGGGGVPDSHDFIAKRLIRYARVVVASPDYLERRGEPVAPEALTQHDAIVHLGASGNGGSWELGGGADSVPIVVEGRLRTNNVHAMRDAARRGLGLALLPDWLVAADLASGALVRVLPGHEGSVTTVQALYRAELRGMARLHAFLDHLAQEPIPAEVPPDVP